MRALRLRKKSVTLRYVDPVASSVSLAGSFNEWNPSTLPLRRKAKGKWEVTIALLPGHYQYRFVVNGKEWREDPSCEKRNPDSFGGYNSVLSVS
jgi:1,4-alpha-glucan branching enzyme